MKKISEMTKSYDTIATAIYLLKNAPDAEYHEPNSKGRGEVIYLNPYGKDAPLTTWIVESTFGVGPDPDHKGAFIIADAYGTALLCGVEDVELSNAYNERKSTII